MTLYSKLEDVPSPEKLSGPLDERIIPLVRGVIAHDILTNGSCEGHMDHGTRYPRVSFDSCDDSRLLELLIDAYNRDSGNAKWCVYGSSIRTVRYANNQEELLRLQASIDRLARFLFQYRPEALDPDYEKRIIRIPDFQRFDGGMQRLYRLLKKIARQQEAASSDKTLKKKFKATLSELDDLEEEAFVSGDIWVKPATERQMRRYLRRAADILEL